MEIRTSNLQSITHDIVKMSEHSGNCSREVSFVPIIAIQVQPINGARVETKPYRVSARSPGARELVHMRVGLLAVPFPCHPSATTTYASYDDVTRDCETTLRGLNRCSSCWPTAGCEAVASEDTRPYTG
jgi:hypothetical protein